MEIPSLFEGNSKVHDIELVIRKRRAYFDGGLSYQALLDIRTMIFNVVFLPLSIFFRSLGLQFHRIELKKFVPGGEFNLKSFYSAICSIEEDFESGDDADRDFIAQEARDRANLSEMGYSLFRKTMNRIRNVNIPSLYASKKAKTLKDNFYTIYKNNFGYYVDPEQKLNYVLTKIYQKDNKKVKTTHSKYFLVEMDYN